MAAVEADDDDTWLYGDGEKKDENETPIKADTSGTEDALVAPGTEEVKLATTNGDDKEAGEVSGGEEAEGENKENEEEEDSDSDSDEDDVQVTIGDIKTQPSYERGHKYKGYQGIPPGGKPGKGVDVDAVGEINGVPTYEFDIDGLQPNERPWHKPGADITDYFNYGFTEETWIKYCAKQRMMRGEAGNKVYIPHAPLPPRNTISDVKVGAKNTSSPADSSADRSRVGPPPYRKMSGTIDVIGSTTRDSRRPAMEFETSYDQPPPADTPNFNKNLNSMPSMSQPPPAMPIGAPIATIAPPMNQMQQPPPNFGGPPPGSMMPPTSVPPPMQMGPPPNMNIPPPAGPPGFPPPVNERFDPFYPPHGGPPPQDRGPPPGYDNRNPFGFDPNQVYGGPPPQFGGPPNAGPPGWDNRGPPPMGYPPGNWDYGPGGPGMPRDSDSDFSSSEDERDRKRYSNRDMYDPFERERSSQRSRERSRDRDRDRERRHRDRERSDRDRDRDRERDDRHRSSKRDRKHDDSDSHRSKHKKSKRSKRDRDDEGEESSTSKQEEAAAS